MPALELERLHLLPRHLLLLQQLLAAHVPQAEVWAYGSRVTGGSHDTSDLDLVLRWPANLQQDVPNWQALQEAIQNSLIPILIDLHLWSRLPASFHRNIEKNYVPVQIGQPQ